jgi:glycosyltransferase involved in cell wall biosynthesis
MRILVMTDDVVGPAMAGSGLRAWELARALAEDHEVRLAAAPGSGAPARQGPSPEPQPPWGWPEAVVAPAWCLPPRAFVGRHRLVVDGVTPLLAELALSDDSRRSRRRRRTAAARLPLVAARADALLTAGPAQVEWWSDRISGRFGLPYLHVPFGIPEGEPGDAVDAIDGVPPEWQVVLWWGGVWPWLDLDTLLAARARLGDVPISIVVPTAPRPGSEDTALTTGALMEAARRHRLGPPGVVALERWIPYGERHGILNRSSLLAVLHRATDEAVLSFRTRAMDGLWAEVPLLLSEGGEVARIARDHGWGAVVPPGDVAATAAALALLLGPKAQQRCREALARDRENWRWPRVTEPLRRTLPRLPLVPRRSLAGAVPASAALLAGWRRA